MNEIKKGDIVTVYRITRSDGKRWYHFRFDARVMTVCDGYAMLRRKGCLPFVEPINQLIKWRENPPLLDNIPSGEPQ